ncbi:MAG: T9SS type A sorting domain-containing protein [Flavobacteriales bacterium]
MKHLLLSSGFFLSVAASGQTYFYVDNIGIDPSAPTTADNISIELIGNLSSTGASVAFTSAIMNGGVVTLTVNSVDPGGLAVLVPHTETIPIGQLAAGTYAIVITGVATGDFAPQPEHTFTVIGGVNLPACDSLVMQGLQYAAYTDSIELVVSNPSSVLFDYPNFILYDDNGDTLAVETVNYFGIGQSPQPHSLAIHPAATLPTGPFSGTLELWTGFTTSLACTFAITDDLCPAASCTDAVVSIINTGGAIVVSSFSWTITDSLGNTAATGQLQLGNAQSDTSSICLPPGNYLLSMTQPAPSGGQLFFGMGDGTGAIVQEAFVQGSTNELEFRFYRHCIDAGTAVTPVPPGADLSITLTSGILLVSANNALGLLRIHDAQGRMVQQQRIPGNTGTIDIGHLASGCYSIVQAQGNIRSTRFVKP